MSKIPSSFNNFKSLNRGSVWALYLLLVIILSARFCNFNNLLQSKPQHVIPNCRCDKIKESYISFMTEIDNDNDNEWQWISFIAMQYI